jgi:AcrR family transcriptional regulator
MRIHFAKYEASPVTITPTRRLMHQDERREQVLRAAAAAFARGGFAATSMDDVAAEAGITRLIVYRHFDSKEDLYRAVLERVAERLRDEFVQGMEHVPGQWGYIVGSMLSAARENPDGFRLLTGHSLREARFASYYDGWWAKAVEVADRMVGTTIADPVIRAWADRTIVAYLVEAVQAWLQVGEAGRDPEFIEQATEGLIAMYVAWATEPPTTGSARPER